MSVTDRLEEAIIAARIAKRMTGAQFVTITEQDAVRILAVLKRRWDVPEAGCDPAYWTVRGDAGPDGDVDMVCTTCRQPVKQGVLSGLWFHADSSNPANCSRTVPVKAMVAEGNENTPSSSEEEQ